MTQEFERDSKLPFRVILGGVAVACFATWYAVHSVCRGLYHRDQPHPSRKHVFEARRHPVPKALYEFARHEKRLTGNQSGVDV